MQFSHQTFRISLNEGMITLQIKFQDGHKRTVFWHGNQFTLTGEECIQPLL